MLTSPNSPRTIKFTIFIKQQELLIQCIIASRESPARKKTPVLESQEFKYHVIERNSVNITVKRLQKVTKVLTRRIGV